MRRLTDDHRFWHSVALPHLAAREVEAGVSTCYCPHSHASFSIGTIRAGENSFEVGGRRHDVAAGAVVLINPDVVHACNPLENRPWSYRMLYADPSWLARVRGEERFVPFAQTVIRDPAMFAALEALVDTLFDAEIADEAKDAQAVAFFAGLEAGRDPEDACRNAALQRAARFIDAHHARRIALAELCAESGLSEAHLIRAFKSHYGLTPHAYQTNRRVQYAQGRLRQGEAIVDVALDAGFADQAHFHRVFRKHVAATPAQFVTTAG